MIGQFSTSPELQNVLKIIRKEPFRYTDDEIIIRVDKFFPSYNCEGAALGYFSIISHLCYFGPDLEKPLIKIAIKPLYYNSKLRSAKIKIFYVRLIIQVCNMDLWKLEVKKS